MDIRKQFGVDNKAAEEGKWFTLQDGGRVRVAKLGCKAFTAEVQRLQKPHVGVLRSGGDTAETLDLITIKAMSKTVLLDWEGLDIDGEPVEYSPENAERLLTEYPEFREFISQLSVDRKNFSPEDVAKK
jgi:hypothetical protein